MYAEYTNICIRNKRKCSKIKHGQPNFKRNCCFIHIYIHTYTYIRIYFGRVNKYPLHAAYIAGCHICIYVCYNFGIGLTQSQQYKSPSLGERIPRICLLYGQISNAQQLELMLNKLTQLKGNLPAKIKGMKENLSACLDHDPQKLFTHIIKDNSWWYSKRKFCWFNFMKSEYL